MATNKVAAIPMVFFLEKGRCHEEEAIASSETQSSDFMFCYQKKDRRA